jgi:hypothetical protein
MNSQYGKAASEAYNAEIRQYTAQFAIAEQLTKPSYFFSDVIREHYRLKADIIKRQLTIWGTASKISSVVNGELDKLANLKRKPCQMSSADIEEVEFQEAVKRSLSHASVSSRTVLSSCSSENSVGLSVSRVDPSDNKPRKRKRLASQAPW